MEKENKFGVKIMWIFESNLSKDNFNDKQYLSQLNSEYEIYENEPINELSFSSFMKFSENGSRLEYENEYFQRRKMLRDFALKAWVYDDKKALKRLEEIMWAVCNEFTWVLPAHLGTDIFNETIDLFAAETAHTLIEIISLLKNSISEAVIKRCIKEVKKRVLQPYINRKEPYGWENDKSNWCAVCGGCISMVAIYLIENDDTVLSVTEGLMPVMQNYIDSFSDDGACLEGLYYWNYGMMYFTAFLDLYKQRFGCDYPTSHEKVKKMAEFPYKCCLGNGYTISFSDSNEHCGIYSGLSYKLHQIYNSPMVDDEYCIGFDGDECGRWCRAVRDIAWSKVSDEITEHNNICLNEAQWAILRNKNMCVAFKGGNNGEPHNHNDVGSIIVLKDGDMLINDLGAGKYTAKYFSDERYDILCNRSKGHSVPIIDSKEQKTGSEFSATDFGCDENKACAGIAGAYDIETLKSCVRTVYCAGGYIAVEDKFEVTETVNITERFITRHNAEVKDGLVEIKINGVCKGWLKDENACDIQINKYINEEHDGTVSEITAIDFTFKVDRDCVFNVKIY